MKKIYLKLLLIATVLAAITYVLNMTVSTKQGINYQVHEIKLPLYLKILDFVDRHYNYKNLTTRILEGVKDDNTKALKILNWVNAHVRKNPRELPVIDDHPFNIIIRGYGVADQFEDIFTILCSYAGMDAFFQIFKNRAGNIYYVSFVKIKGKWCPVSAYEGVYLIKNGSIASVGDVLSDQKNLRPFLSNLSNFEAESFLKEISNMDFNALYVRVKGQSPAGRLLCIIRSKFRGKR